VVGLDVLVDDKNRVQLFAFILCSSVCTAYVCKYCENTKTVWRLGGTSVLRVVLFVFYTG